MKEFQAWFHTMQHSQYVRAGVRTKWSSHVWPADWFCASCNDYLQRIRNTSVRRPLNQCPNLQAAFKMMWIWGPCSRLLLPLPRESSEMCVGGFNSFFHKPPWWFKDRIKIVKEIFSGYQRTWAGSADLTKLGDVDLVETVALSSLTLLLAWERFLEYLHWENLRSYIRIKIVQISQEISVGASFHRGEAPVPFSRECFVLPWPQCQ